MVSTWRTLGLVALLILGGGPTAYPHAPQIGQALGQRESQPTQATQAADTVRREPRAIPTAEIAPRAERANSRLLEIRARISQGRSPADLEAEVAPLLSDTDSLLAEMRARDLENAQSRALENLRQRWSALASRLNSWQERLATRVEALQVQRDTLQRMRAVWQLTRDSASVNDLPDATLGQIDGTLSAIGEVQTALRQRLNALLTLQNRVVQRKIDSDQVLARIATARERVRLELFTPTQPPLWQAILEPQQDGSLVEEISASLNDYTSAVVEYAKDRQGTLLLSVGLFLALLSIMLVLRSRTQELAQEDPAFQSAAHVLQRPISAAFLLVLVLIPRLAPNASVYVVELVWLISFVPVLRLVPGLLPATLRAPLYALIALNVMQLLQGLGGAHALVPRLILLGTALVACGGLVWILRPKGRFARATRNRWWRGASLVARLGLVTLGIAVLADVLGYVPLAHLLTWETLGSAYLAIVLFAGAQVLGGLVRVGLRHRFARSFNAVRTHTRLITRRGIGAVNFAALVVWALDTLAGFNVLGPLRTWLASILGAEWSVGSLTLSLGAVLAFFLALWLASLLSRFVDFMLEEDVLPRVELPRGVPGAISKLAHYVILGVGFFIALAAAGISLDRFALVLGAFGVGIGFGLQNIVNNFVSGLILIFERPIQVGDTIQLEDLLGDVSRIGIRSSTVRSWEGAEVIVPNANLISSQVVNWTLSDRHRRLDIPVGVEYGTDPKRAIEILRTVAAEHPDVLESPEPVGLFRGFGDSSLNFTLRVWTPRFEQWARVDSELRVAVYAALNEAGITIPFPQRDLHLRSVDAKKVPAAVKEILMKTDGEPRSGSEEEKSEKEATKERSPSSGPE